MADKIKKRITEEECEALFARYGTPAHVIRHCRAVCRVAVALGEELNRHGFSMDIPLIRGAALAHDVARVSEDHAKEGADILDDLGFHDEAGIVRVHMKYDFHSFDRLDETDLVCLADRLVKEDRYVGLDERIEYILHKAPDIPEIHARIMAKKAETKALMDRIEQAVGKSIDALLNT
ncbi:MAG: HD domain-containing protein [Emergencia sp.]